MMRVVEVPLDEVPANAELAADVRDAQGVRLMAAGIRLRPGSLEKLARRGVERVAVWQTVDNPAEAERRRRTVAEQLDHRFRKTADAPLMPELRAALEKFMVENAP